MKRIIFAPLLLICILASGQAIRRVNNAPGMSAPFTTIDAAITAASPGDIILVEGSATDYSLPTNYTLSKKVKIQGPGFLLDVNTGLQASPLSAIMSYSGSFIFASGSEGSAISGMVSRNPMEIRVSDITLSYNSLYTIVLNNSVPCSNFWFHANYPGSFNTFGTPLITAPGPAAYTNIVISNNIFNWRVDLGTTKYGLFINNIIDSNPAGASNLTNFEVVNSIFNNLSGLTLTNANVQNNVFCGTGYYPAFDPSLNNITNANVASLFVGLPGNTYDTQYRLKSGSPAIGAGINGADAGMFGGPNPYQPSGITPGLPTITNLTVPGMVPQNSALNAKVSAKSN